MYLSYCTTKQVNESEAESVIICRVVRVITGGDWHTTMVKGWLAGDE
jgi:hypothetical protein